MEADEVSYPLHIILRYLGVVQHTSVWYPTAPRYELERSLIRGEIAVEDLPRLWNEKAVHYLGKVPLGIVMGHVAGFTCNTYH